MKLFRSLTLLIVFCWLLVASVTADAAEGWEVTLKVKAGVAENKLTFGQKPDATNGIDGRYDVPAMLAGDVQACFVEEGKTYWRDIKALAPAALTVWELRIEAARPGPIELDWAGIFPEGAIASLSDPTDGKHIDMRAQKSYVFNGDGVRSLRIETVK